MSISHRALQRRGALISGRWPAIEHKASDFCPTQPGDSLRARQQGRSQGAILG